MIRLITKEAAKEEAIKYVVVAQEGAEGILLSLETVGGNPIIGGNIGIVTNSGTLSLAHNFCAKGFETTKEGYIKVTKGR